MFKSFCLVLLATAVLAAPSSKIESRLTVSLLGKGSANVLVTMNARPTPVISKLHTRTFSSRAERLETVGHTLMEHAEKTQKEVIAVLGQQKETVDYEVFWITNQVYIRNAKADLINQIAALDSVKEISEEFEVKLDPIIQEENKEGRTGILAEWNVENIEAHLAWELPGGNMGEGVIVGSIDTGFNPDHVDLAPNYVGEYGWKDATVLQTPNPRDGNGHGTHTIGSMVGLNGLGVAPGAKFCSCKALTDQGSGTNAGLISCGQFMTCPTLPNGSSPNCTRAPHVINNSWGGGQANPFFNDVINAWHASFIIPVFANGNSGPDCRTANSPADSLAGVIGVGATDSSNGLASFSSKGPTLGGNQKPDISGPGYQVRSAWMGGSAEYNTISGTSMAAPHVAGVVALLKSVKSDFTYAQIRDLLIPTTNKEVTPSGMTCNSVDESQWPNYSFGHGIVNAHRALRAALGLK